MSWKQPGVLTEAIATVRHSSIWRIDGAVKVATGVAADIDAFCFRELGIIDEKIGHQIAELTTMPVVLVGVLCAVSVIVGFPVVFANVAPSNKSKCRSLYTYPADCRRFSIKEVGAI